MLIIHCYCTTKLQLFQPRTTLYKVQRFKVQEKNKNVQAKVAQQSNIKQFNIIKSKSGSGSISNFISLR